MHTYILFFLLGCTLTGISSSAALLHTHTHNELCKHPTGFKLWGIKTYDDSTLILLDATKDGMRYGWMPPYHKTIKEQVIENIENVPEQYRLNLCIYSDYKRYFYSPHWIYWQGEPAPMVDSIKTWLDHVFPDDDKKLKHPSHFPKNPFSEPFAQFGSSIDESALTGWLGALIESFRHQPKNIYLFTHTWGTYNKPLTQEALEALWLEAGYTKAMHKQWLSKLTQAEALLEQRKREAYKRYPNAIINFVSAASIAKIELGGSPPPFENRPYTDAQIYETVTRAIDYHYTSKGVEKPQLHIAIYRHGDDPKNNALYDRFTRLIHLFKQGKIRLIIGLNALEAL